MAAKTGGILKAKHPLVAEHINVTWQQRHLIDNVSMYLEEGEILGLIGPNGAGKSTLLKVLAQLTAYRGDVEYKGQKLRDLNVQERARTIAYLQQSAEVSWPISVRDYVALGRFPYQRYRLRQQKQTCDQQVITAAMQQTGLSHLASRRVHQLSGGEFARVRLARTLAVEAPLLLADEPVAVLDPFHQLQVMELLKALCHKGKSIIVVLHDLTLASRFCDRLLLLNEGRLVAAGEPRKVLTPANLQQVYKVKAMVGEHQQQAYVVPWACHAKKELSTEQ